MQTMKMRSKFDCGASKRLWGVYSMRIKTKGLKVYISGKMGGRLTKEVLAERALARGTIKAYGMIPIDPLEKEPSLVKGKKISLKTPLQIMRGIVDSDLGLMEQSDYIVVLTGDECSDGTWWEMVMAHFLYDKPVYVVSPLRKNGVLMGWTNVVMAERIFKSLRDALDAILIDNVLTKGEIYEHSCVQ